MLTPAPPIRDWFDKWTLAVNIFIAIGTVGSVIVALFGSFFKNKFFPPKLSLKLLSAEGEPIALNSGTPSRYYHLQVSNPRKWSPATNLSVRLLRIDVPAPGGSYVADWKGNVAIHCRNQAVNPLTHTVGPEMDFDICSALQTGAIQLHPIVTPNNLKTVRYLNDGGLDFILYLQARSVEVDSEILKIKIAWDGVWIQGTTEFQNHFRIETLT